MSDHKNASPPPRRTPRAAPHEKRARSRRAGRQGPGFDRVESLSSTSSRGVAAARRGSGGALPEPPLSLRVSYNGPILLAKPLDRQFVLGHVSVGRCTRGPWEKSSMSDRGGGGAAGPLTNASPRRRAPRLPRRPRRRGAIAGSGPGFARLRGRTLEEPPCSMWHAWPSSR